MTLPPNQVIVLEDTPSLFMDFFPDIIGCLGTLIILIAYILLQSRKLDAHHVLFSFLNLVGALMILISLLYSWNLAAVVMEVAWASISAFGILQILFPYHLRLRRRRDEKKRL